MDKETDNSIRSSAQGLFMIMTNGIGATIGSFAAGAIIDHFVNNQTDALAKIHGWQTSWHIFAAYAALVAVLFTLIFRYKDDTASSH